MNKLSKLAFVAFIMFAIAPAYSVQFYNNESMVPSTSPASHFQNNGDGTVSDKSTG